MEKIEIKTDSRGMYTVINGDNMPIMRTHNLARAIQVKSINEQFTPIIELICKKLDLCIDK